LTINRSTFKCGGFINALIAFVSIAAAVFFFVVRPYNFFMARAKRGEEQSDAEKPEDVVLLTEIRHLLKNRG